MPFTFSHPAIILPLTYLPKCWFSLTGLVIGSLMPDFEYFLRMNIKSVYSHTLEGIFWFDLPLGLLTAFIFHNLIRNHLFENLPFILKSRFINYIDFDWNSYFKKNWLVVLFSILIGTTSHIFWDSFTHDTGYFVKSFPQLKDSIKVLNYQIPILKILQHSSTFIGGLFICISIYKLPSFQIQRKVTNIYYWIIFFTGFILLSSLLNTFKINALGTFIISIISVSILSLILTSILLSLNSKTLKL